MPAERRGGIVRFVVDEDPAAIVEYPLVSGCHVPRVGESVASDGTDPAFPGGAYTVTHVTTGVTLRGGPTLVVVDVRTVRRFPESEVRAAPTLTDEGRAALAATTEQGADHDR